MLIISKSYWDVLVLLPGCQICPLIGCLEREIDIKHVVSSMLSLPYSKVDWE